MIIVFLILWPIIGFLSSLGLIHDFNKSFRTNPGFRRNDFHFMIVGAMGGYVMFVIFLGTCAVNFCPKQIGETWDKAVNWFVGFLNKIVYKH